MPRLIGLHGRAGSGKDTAFEAIWYWGRFRHIVRREAFADRLKLSAARIFFPDISLAEAVEWCNGLKLCGAITAPGNVVLSGREFLQHYGTEAHRNVFAESFWVDAALQGYGDTDEILVVTDVRFVNEAKAIQDRGGEVWEILRPHVGIAESAHASEQPLPAEMIDHTVVNDGTVDDLGVVVRRLMDAAVSPTQG